MFLDTVTRTHRGRRVAKIAELQPEPVEQNSSNSKAVNVRKPNPGRTGVTWVTTNMGSSKPRRMCKQCKKREIPDSESDMCEGCTREYYCTAWSKTESWRSRTPYCLGKGGKKVGKVDHSYHAYGIPHLLYDFPRLKPYVDIRTRFCHMSAAGFPKKFFGVCGMAGCGKTHLVAQACYDPLVRDLYPGGIFWLDLAEEKSVEDILSFMADSQQKREGDFFAEEDAFVTKMKKVSAMVPCFAVIIDHLSPENVDRFVLLRDSLPEQARLVAVTTYCDLLDPGRNDFYWIGTLGHESSRNYMKLRTHKPADKVEGLVARAEGNIMVMDFLSGEVNLGLTCEETCSLIDDNLNHIGEDTGSKWQKSFYDHVYKCFSNLDPGDKDLFLALAGGNASSNHPTASGEQWWRLFCRGMAMIRISANNNTADAIYEELCPSISAMTIRSRSSTSETNAEDSTDELYPSFWKCEIADPAKCITFAMHNIHKMFASQNPHLGMEVSMRF